MHIFYYIIPILVSGLIGWLSIWLLIKLLYWPRNPVSVLVFKFQGLLPKYQPAIAQKLAGIATKELFSFSSLKDKAADPAHFEKLKPELEKHIDHFLREKLKESFPMLSMVIGDKTINQLKAAFLLELEGLFPVIMASYLSNLEKDIDPGKLVAEKIEGFSMYRTKDILKRSAGSLFLRLQLFGFVLGLFSGIIQAFIYLQLLA